MFSAEIKRENFISPVARRVLRRSKHYGVGILVGEATRNAVKDVIFREVDRIRVKGRDAAITVYEPLGLDGELGRELHEELKLWNQTLRAYRAQQWDQADVNLLNLQRLNPGCELYRKFSDKVAEKRSNPPQPDWDGVSVFNEK